MVYRLPVRLSNPSKASSCHATKAILPREKKLRSRGVSRVAPGRAQTAGSPRIALLSSTTSNLDAVAKLLPLTGVIRSVRHAPTSPALNETSNTVWSLRVEPSKLAWHPLASLNSSFQRSLQRSVHQSASSLFCHVLPRTSTEGTLRCTSHVLELRRQTGQPCW
jgi:hypothetical protein